MIALLKEIASLLRSIDARLVRMDGKQEMHGNENPEPVRAIGEGNPIWPSTSHEQTEQIRRTLDSKNAFDSYRVDPGADGPALRPSRDIMFDTRPRDE